MIKLYYTTSSEESFGNETIQDKVKNSLGGYKSSSLVSNNVLGNLFGDVSMMAASNEQLTSQYVAIMAVNEAETTLTGVEVWFEYEDKESCQSTMKIAEIDPNSEGVIERIPTRTSMPMYAEFSEPDSDNKLSIGDMVAGEVVGLWINRELLPSVMQSQYDDIVEEDPTNSDLMREKGNGKVDSVALKISWA